MRKELRELRKETVKPVSRMRKGDIASELEKLRETRETTAPVASTRGAGVAKSRAATESVKEAKSKEFPVKPAPKEAAPKKKGGMKAKLAKMLEMMESSDEE